GPCQQRLVVVDDDQALQRRDVLCCDRADRCDQVVPALFGVGADDDAEGGVRHAHALPLSVPDPSWLDPTAAWSTSSAEFGRSSRTFTRSLEESVRSIVSSAWRAGVGRGTPWPQRERAVSWRSRKIVFSTRQPSRNVFRRLSPEIRLRSKLGTSAMRRPA